MNPRSWTLPLCLLLGAAPAVPGRAAQAAKATLEWSGQYGGDPSPGAEVVMDAGQWGRLWRRLERPAPPLDFSRYCAVVAFAGQRPTGGFTLEFLPPIPQGKDLRVRWRVHPPSPQSYVTEAFAQPWHVKAFPRPGGGVKLERMDP